MEDTIELIDLFPLTLLLAAIILIAAAVIGLISNSIFGN